MGSLTAEWTGNNPRLTCAEHPCELRAPREGTIGVANHTCGRAGEESDLTEGQTLAIGDVLTAERIDQIALTANTRCATVIVGAAQKTTSQPM